MRGLLVDVTKCTGCEKCVSACIETNRLDRVKADNDRLLSKDGLSANRLLSILNIDDGRFARKACMHCVEPSCVSACLVGGITKSPEGPVIYDPDKCIGCRYCMLACPFHIPRYEWDKAIPFMKKCEMCYERQTGGKQPACVEACPNNALHFGDRDELLKTAHQMIKQNPDVYLPRIWGEHEFGGTSVMYISDVNLDELGWADPEAEAIPALTEPLIAKTPIIGFSVMGSLLGMNWIIRRRTKLGKVEETGGQSGHENADGGEND